MENLLNVEALTLAETEWLMYELLKKYDLHTYDTDGYKISVVTCMHELAIIKKTLYVDEVPHDGV